MPALLTLELPPGGDLPERLLSLHARHPERYPVLLESSERSTPEGSHTMLLARPGVRLSLDNGGKLTGPGSGTGFCQRLDQWCGALPGSAAASAWPFAGGWFLYLGYELAGEIEPSLRLPPSPLALVAMAWRMHGAIVMDHRNNRAAAMAESPELLATMQADLAGSPGRVDQPGALLRGAVSEDDPEQYIAACQRALAHIAAGDVYQANLARAWRAPLAAGVGAADVYARLRQANPGAFSGIARIDGLSILSSSPERLVRVRGSRVDTRPIAGTRPRLPGGDRVAIAELTGSAKERAEHVMLIDLERNDLGRICEPGSVQVDEFMAVESYAHVHHIVSNVSGRLSAGVTPGAVIRALFPGGTITGCPKVRCMQLIGELEGAGRGAYTGAIGYLSADGNLDLNILIRTLTVQQGIAEIRAGAGIVADSDPRMELEETRAKARGVLQALGVPAA